MAIAEIVSRALGILDGWFAISPEQRVIRYKDKIDKLKKEKSELLKKKCDPGNSDRLNRINNDIRLFEDRIKNEAR